MTPPVGADPQRWAEYVESYDKAVAAFDDLSRALATEPKRRARQIDWLAIAFAAVLVIMALALGVSLVVATWLAS